MRSPTKAQAILNEAMKRVQSALAERDSLRVLLEKAQAIYEERLDAHRLLEMSLARAPRKVTKKPARNIDSGMASRTIVGPACGICGNIEGHPDHDTDHYLSAHEFESGKSSAPSVGKKSTRKTRAQQSEVNFETEKDAVTNAAGVASGGD